MRADSHESCIISTGSSELFTYDRGLGVTFEALQRQRVCDIDD